MNYFKTLSEDVEEIDIKGQGLTFLPSLSHFKNLKKLDASINQLTYITDFPETLEYINIQGNRLKQIPPFPKNLKTFIASHNQLESLPDTPDTLISLFCKSNRIEKLPKLSINLQRMNVSNNLIESIESFPPKLKILVLRNNIISSLPTLPKSIYKIDIAENNISKLPEIPINTRILNCEDNGIQEIKSLPKRLEQFHCQQNLLREYPELPKNLRIYDGHTNPNPFRDFSLPEIFKLQEFRYNYFTQKFGPKIKKYFYNQLKNRKKDLHQELVEVYYSPDLPFYKNEWIYLSEGKKYLSKTIPNPTPINAVDHPM